MTPKNQFEGVHSKEIICFRICDLNREIGKAANMTWFWNFLGWHVLIHPWAFEWDKILSVKWKDFVNSRVTEFFKIFSLSRLSQVMWNHCASLRPSSCDRALQSCGGVVVGVLLARPSSGETCYDPILGLCIAMFSKAVPCSRAGFPRVCLQSEPQEFRETKPLPPLFPVYACFPRFDQFGFKKPGSPSSIELTCLEARGWPPLQRANLHWQCAWLGLRNRQAAWLPASCALELQRSLQD